MPSHKDHKAAVPKGEIARQFLKQHPQATVSEFQEANPDLDRAHFYNARRVLQLAKSKKRNGSSATRAPKPSAIRLVKSNDVAAPVPVAAAEDEFLRWALYGAERGWTQRVYHNVAKTADASAYR